MKVFEVVPLRFLLEARRQGKYEESDYITEMRKKAKASMETEAHARVVEIKKRRKSA